MAQRVRADQVLVDRKIFSSRTSAQVAIEGGSVLVNGRPILKASSLIAPGDDIKILEMPKYVSRGGLKLEKALSAFGVDCTGKNCVDVGASTGGFTDCLLKHGSAHVWAIDVGYGQLHQKLRNDARVSVIERTNVRDLDREMLPDNVDIITVDVSFISIAKITAKLLEMMGHDTLLITLIKPQFEAGAKLVRKGVLKDPEAHISTLASLLTELNNSGLDPQQLEFSPIRGPKGNIEYLAMFVKKTEVDLPESESDLGKAVYNVIALRELVEKAFKETGPRDQ